MLVGNDWSLRANAGAWTLLLSVSVIFKMATFMSIGGVVQAVSSSFKYVATLIVN